MWVFWLYYQNKKRPELILKVDKHVFSEFPVVFSMDGRLAFVKSHLCDMSGVLTFVFDLVERKFACFGVVTDNICFSIKEMNSNEFILAGDEVQMAGNPTGLLKKAGRNEDRDSGFGVENF